MLFKIFQVFEKLQHVRTMFPTLHHVFHCICKKQNKAGPPG